MANPVDARRRWFGAFFLLMAGGLLVWGQTVLKTILLERPILFLIYWLACFACTGLAVLIALIDALVLHKRSRAEQREIFKRSFPKSESSSGDSTESSSGENR